MRQPQVPPTSLPERQVPDEEGYPVKAKYTAEQIQANRQKFVSSLRRSRRQCVGTLFEGQHACAIGIAARALFKIRDEADYNARLAASRNDLNVYGDVAEALGIGDGFGSKSGMQIDDLWRWNDREELSFNQIADKLVEVWGL